MMNPAMIVLVYFAIGLLTLMCSRSTVKNGQGFEVVWDVLVLVGFWPAALTLRLIIFVIEGNLWEDL